MSAIDDIGALVDTMRSRKGEMTSFEGLLSEISVALGDIVLAMERSTRGQDIADALKGLTFQAPDVHVNVQPSPAPEVNVTVQPAAVTVMPPEASPITGWTLQVTSRDGNGAIRTISLKPEK